MVINALDHVAACYTWEDGRVIAGLIRSAFRRSEAVILSMSGVDDVPSSFVNAAFVELLDDYSHAHIRKNLRIIDSTPQINRMIRRRFDAEAGALAA